MITVNLERFGEILGCIRDANETEENYKQRLIGKVRDPAVKTIINITAEAEAIEHVSVKMLESEFSKGSESNKKIKGKTLRSE